jgi:hypothetical protein
MKKEISKSRTKSRRRKRGDDEMLPEYDFSGGVRGKYFRAYRQGYTVTVYKDDGTVEERHFKPAEGVVVLDRDVRKYFPDAESVNSALRALIAIFPQKPHRTKAKTRDASK